MYAGKIVETGLTADIMNRPLHPYTKALLDSVPQPGSRGTQLRSIEGQPPDPIDLPESCAFAERCSMAQDRCFKESPEEIKIDENHYVRCFHVGK